MGYAHGKKWSKGEIIKEIRLVMKTLNIERMPSNSECFKATKNYGLGNKISRTGGFYEWDNKLNLETKDSGTKKGLKAENGVIKLINQYTGLNAIVTQIKAPYDILINKKVKIEVKYSNGYFSNRGNFYSANLYNGLQKADILIFICKNEKIGDKNLIIPSHHLQGLKQLSIGKISKYDKYIDKWDYIIKFNDFLSSF